MRITMHQTIGQTISRVVLVLCAGAAVSLAGCSSAKKAAGPASYDFGPAAGVSTAPAKPLAAVVVPDATGPVMLDSERMHYRLHYDNPLQSRYYANSRWNSTPLELLTQRFKTRMAQAGTKVLAGTDAAAGVPILRMELDDFSHHFTSPSNSVGQVRLRASLFSGHKLIDQKVFESTTVAASADAAGGAQALTVATDALAADVIAWTATLPVAPR
jgi:cholesterol transport system auxiliary component